MSQKLRMQTSILAMLSTACGQGSEPDVRRALQAVVEGVPFGKSSLDDKLVATFEGMSFTEAKLRETTVHYGQRRKRHRNGGGWVPAEQDEHDESKPFVEKTAYVGPFARVTDNAQLSGDAWMFDDEVLVDGMYGSRAAVEAALKRR